MRRSQQISGPILSNDYIYLYKSDLNIDQANDRKSFDEVVSCWESNNWLTIMQEEFKSMQDHDV